MRSPQAYLRNIEDIFGDTSSESLTFAFPKWTNLHDFICEIITDLIFEDRDKEGFLNSFWVDDLIRSNGIARDTRKLISHNEKCSLSKSADEYLDELGEKGVVEEVCEDVTKQAFHVLFANRGTLTAFGHLVAGYVENTAPAFAATAYTKLGYLKRVKPPKWAQNAVFHRDKGRCVICRADLTKVLSQQTAAHFDHIVPLKLGGRNCVTNLQLLCGPCNLAKGARSSQTSNYYEAWY